MGNVPAGFHGKDEAGRRLVTPQFKGLPAWKAVKGIVDLDGLEVLDVKIQHFVVPHIFRIEWPSPVRIVPARRSDLYLRRHRPSPPLRTLNYSPAFLISFYR